MDVLLSSESIPILFSCSSLIVCRDSTGSPGVLLRQATINGVLLLRSYRAEHRNTLLLLAMLS